MGAFRGISGAVWGANLYNMRQLYVTKVRPIISYACAAWFNRGAGVAVPWQLSRKLIDDLESLQYRCLVQVSGAMAKTSYNVLLKELDIESVEVFLHRVSIAQRAQSLDTPEYKELEALWLARLDKVPSSARVCEHPYRVLFDDARDLAEEARRSLLPDESAWLDTARRNRAIKRCARQRATAAMSERWEAYRMVPGKKECPALVEPWGPRSLRFYRGLPRAQSTMLLRCRTGRIGLRNYLFFINVDRTKVGRPRF